MIYQTRKGIVLTSVGGQKMLVSAVPLHKEVPYVTNINETTAICWELLEKKADEETLVQRILDEFETDDPSMVRDDIHALLMQLLEKGFIIKEEY